MVLAKIHLKNQLEEQHYNINYIIALDIKIELPLRDIQDR
jgi:hypothetical protein